MGDPELVSRARHAAARLEWAWERWRTRHGLGGPTAQPVASYVGYSPEEPRGRPRVVFGVDALEAEQLAALLDADDDTGAAIAQEAGYAGGYDYDLGTDPDADRWDVTAEENGSSPGGPARPASQPAGYLEDLQELTALEEQARVPSARREKAVAEAPENTNRDAAGAGADCAVAAGEPATRQAGPAVAEAGPGEGASGPRNLAAPAANWRRGAAGLAPGRASDGNSHEAGGGRAKAPAPSGPAVSSIAAELAGWASSELPGQASAGLAALTAAERKSRERAAGPPTPRNPADREEGGRLGSLPGPQPGSRDPRRPLGAKRGSPPARGIALAACGAEGTAAGGR